MLENVKNVPTYAYNYRAVVIREVDGDWWYWGAYNDCSAANAAAVAIGGEIVWLSN